MNELIRERNRRSNTKKLQYSTKGVADEFSEALAENFAAQKRRVKSDDNQFWNEWLETLPREELEALQLEELKEIVRFAYENSPYYKRAFDEAGVGPKDIKTLQDLSRFPFVNKQTERETQGVGSFLGEMCAVPEQEVVFISTSSGSTGVPTVSPFSKQDFDEFQDVESRLFYQAGMRNTDRYVHSLNFSLFVGGPDVIGAQNLGALCIWAGTVPSERLLFILKEYQPTMIWTTPSYAWYLGEAAKKHGIDPAKDLSIRKIIVAGEAGGSIPSTRKAIEELWDAELFDFFGISDIFGACAAQCEAHDGLHLAEDHVLVEVLDTHTGEPVKDGERGELVFTTLRKHARPMIRFKSGDIGYVNREKCSCGRTHTRIYVVGRKDDMFIVSGVNVFPSDVEYVIRGIEGITGEYVIRVYEKDYTTKYKVEIEKASDHIEEDEALAARVSAALKGRVGVKPTEVKVLKDGTLPRATHKATRLIDERVQG